MLQYQKAGQNNSLSGDDVEESGEIVTHQGKIYRRVQIEDDDQEFLMDEDKNIYDLNFQKVGTAGDDDDELDEAQF
jgi:hypothetical protein